MPSYKVKIIEKIEEAQGTLSLRLEKPEGFSYVAGQHSVVKVQTQEDPLPFSVRTFSFSSAPSEAYLQITMRKGRSPFKKYLQTAKLGTEIELFEPVGKFVMHEDMGVPVVMIAGGIGISVFRSMLIERASCGVLGDIVLLYSNTTLECVAFKKGFDSLHKNIKTQEHKNKFKFEVLYTLTEEAPEGWEGETGRIDAAMIRKYVPDLAKPVYYVCGPVQMVKDVSGILYDVLGIEKDKVRCEEFTGY